VAVAGIRVKTWKRRPSAAPTAPAHAIVMYMEFLLATGARWDFRRRSAGRTRWLDFTMDQHGARRPNREIGGDSTTIVIKSVARMKPSRLGGVLVGNNSATPG
jgi:hypothetical protein